MPPPVPPLRAACLPRRRLLFSAWHLCALLDVCRMLPLRAHVPRRAMWPPSGATVRRAMPRGVLSPLPHTELHAGGLRAFD